MTDPKDAAEPERANFEEALSRLEAIVQALEEGQIPLADALARYAEGIKLLKACYQTLEHAERRIEMLNRVDQQGAEHSEPFDDSALSLDQKAQTRSRRRSRDANSSSASEQNEIDESGRLF